MKRFAFFLLTVALAGAASQRSTGVVADSQMELHARDDSTLDLAIVVNGISHLLVHETQIDLKADSLPPLPWAIVIRTSGGRRLASMSVRSGDVVSGWGIEQGVAVRLALSCGRIDVWSGP